MMPEPIPSTTLFTQRREIVPDDTDAAGIVYTPRIANFTVETVERWFAERMQADAATTGLQIVFASLSCTFLSPMRAGEILEISIALRRVGRSSLGFELVGHAEADDRLCWMAETVCVCVDPATLCSRPIPAALHGVLHAEAALADRMPFGDRSVTA
ncbi:acyl-CoA thioesterase [Lichenicoccus sp.]|uniref:acyl-CoA thioesterase n=1 Tax=Lichenicoccus sp. TaxID=2781899 RepID=UPI003D1520D7